MTIEANKTLVREFVETVKNRRELTRMGDYFQTDYLEHNETVASFGKSIDASSAVPSCFA